jgi:2-polyprenyl-3-methyl-5-hydroxy-6-metoxy-1,4-benzoquinol methylase
MQTEYLAAYRDLYRRHWWWRVREGILLREVQQLLHGRHARARILDVGCGAGLFFDALEPFGDVEGIESDRDAVEQSGRWRPRIHLGGIETFASRGEFDLVLMLDVLEHVPNPDAMLRHAATLLAPKGQLLITVPAFDALWTSHDEINGHVKRYAAREVRQLVQHAGLNVVNTRYLFQSLTLLKLAVRAKEAVIRPENAVPQVPASPLNAALQAWFRAEHRVAGWLPFGSSVMAIAERAA